jgi:hypothetical protein
MSVLSWSKGVVLENLLEQHFINRISLPQLVLWHPISKINPSSLIKSERLRRDDPLPQEASIDMDASKAILPNSFGYNYTQERSMWNQGITLVGSRVTVIIGEPTKDIGQR